MNIIGFTVTPKSAETLDKILSHEKFKKMAINPKRPLSKSVFLRFAVCNYFDNPPSNKDLKRWREKDLMYPGPFEDYLESYLKKNL